MLKALIFDSYYDKHRGVVAYIRLFAGELRADQEIWFLAANKKAFCQEVGYFKPQMTPSQCLKNGEVGYLVTGLKDIELVKVGDTVANKKDLNLALPGYKQVEPKVFSSLYPVDASDYPKLKEAIAKLKLSDSSLVYETEHIPALGYGYRCGFLGLLHMDIVQERLSREFDLNLILTTPSVKYQVGKTDGQNILIHTPSELPDPSHISKIKEPYIKLEVLTPEEHVGKIIELVTSKRGNYQALNLISSGQIQLTGEMPLAEMVIDFYDELKSLTKGYATMSYELIDFRENDLVKIDFLVNQKIVSPLSIIAHRSQADQKSRRICEKLKELIPRQLFEIALQASIGSRVIARETVKACRKHVTAKRYGGDMTRRKKLLEKQKKGKKRMKMVGNVEIPQSAFLNILKK